MSSAVIGVRAQRRFYLWMSAGCLAIAVLGFMPTYFVPMSQGSFKAEPIVHLHGLILFSWVLFFFTQSWLVAQGKILSHRTWGMLGIALMTAMSFVIVAVVSMRIAQAQLPGQPEILGHQARAFSWISISTVIFIVPCFILAIVKLRDTETHKRLILLLTIAMLGAPIARWFLTFLAPPGAVPVALPGLPLVTAPPISVTIAPALVGDVLFVVALIRDWRTLGRIHPVYAIGGSIMLLLQVTVVPVAESPAWQAIATAIGQLAG